MNRCLYCYAALAAGQGDFHPACAKKMFGSVRPPTLPYTRADIDALAKKAVIARATVAGVQPKLSMDIARAAGGVARMTIAGPGRYIVKPQAARFPHLPENEDLTLHLAELAGVRTVPHTLIRLENGELCYLTRRIDRTATGEKIPMEDMCQLTKRPSANKYLGSYEGIAKEIRRHSAFTGFDLAALAEVVLFSFLTGNADMHLKNFSLYAPDGAQRLTPAYDLLNTRLPMPKDREEMALTLNAKKSRLKRADFAAAFAAFGLNAKVVAHIFEKFESARAPWLEFIARSFLPTPAQSAYAEIVEQRFERVQ